GLGSNLDVNSIVSQLMAIEQQPLQKLARQEASYQAKLSAFGSLKSALSSLQSAMSGLATSDRFNGFRSSISDSSLASVVSGSGAVPGSYSLEVQYLAQAHKLKSTTFAATTDSVGTGTISIDFGTYSGGAFTLNPDKATKTITIASGSDTLSAVRDAINTANAGVTATIVNDGTGNRLVIGSKDSGAANALRISVADTDGNNTDTSGLSRLAYDAASGGTVNMTETVLAQNSTVVIDGMTISKPTNAITDAIAGVTINLNKAALGTTATVNITRDLTSANNAVDSFVKAYNELDKTIDALTAYNAETKVGAILQGDSTVRTIQSRIRGLLTTGLSTAGGGLSNLSQIGVSFQLDGTLKLDSAKLNAVLNDPSKDVATLFSAIAKPSDSQVSFVSASSAVKPGNYALNVSHLATRGNAVASVVANTTITAGVNDALSFTVDGKSASITLNAGTYTAASLAAAIQSKVNGVSTLSADDVSVTVTQSGGVLTMTSNRYGSASSVTTLGGTAAADLFGVATSTTGTDVVGTIGGVSASGSGQNLNLNGLAVKITGGGTGNRGTLNFARGFASQIADAISELVDSDGVIAGRTDGLNRSIKDIDTRRQAFNTRLVSIEKRYRAQFTNLDIMMSSMTKTSAFLEQQLKNLPKLNNDN
ncbi:MAG TPA: flagellar filament capping protein FliD, partial [Burkholderiales bacterium]|nr:flagellar filament capping protein FliD [Burkholderiales bacterium]